MSTRPSSSYQLHQDRLFSGDTNVRAVARSLYSEIKNLPIVSPHGHTDPSWFADNKPFGNPASLLLQPDHYVFRMLYSQGISLESLGIPAVGSGVEVEQDSRKAWQIFADNYHLFHGTPSRMWMDHALTEVLGVDLQLNGDTAGVIYEHVDGAVAENRISAQKLV